MLLGEGRVAHLRQVQLPARDSIVIALLGEQVFGSAIFREKSVFNHQEFVDALDGAGSKGLQIYVPLNSGRERFSWIGRRTIAIKPR